MVVTAEGAARRSGDAPPGEAETPTDRAAALRASWPALDRLVIGGWHADFSEGLTFRANSVWMLGSSGDPLGAIGTVEEACRVRGVPSRFLVTAASDQSDLDTLGSHGYATVRSARVLALPAAREALPGSEQRLQEMLDAHSGPLGVETSRPSAPEGWISAWLKWSGHRLARDKRLAPRLFAGVPSTFFAARDRDRHVVALARLTIIGRFAVLDRPVAEPSARGRAGADLLVRCARHEALAAGVSSCLAMLAASDLASSELLSDHGFEELDAVRFLECPGRMSCC